MHVQQLLEVLAGMVGSGKPWYSSVNFGKWKHMQTLQKLETIGGLYLGMVLSILETQANFGKSQELFFPTCPIHCMVSCCKSMHV
jgi:hypothetical protein